MPESAQLNILLETGADFILPYTIYDDDDNPIDLTGATVRAYLRESAAAPDYYEFLCRHNDAGGRITITMPHETTSEITFTSGVYDVVVVFEDGTTSYPLHGDATIRQGITKITDGNVLFMIGISSYEDLPEIGNVDRLYFSYEDQVIYRWNGMNYIATAVGRGVVNITAVLHGNIITYTIIYTDGTTSTIDLDYNLLDSPSFIGTPTAPTPESGDDSTRIATTEYVTDAISGKQDTLTFDTTPTANSTNPVTSGGVKTALDAKANTADLGTLAGKDSIDTGDISSGTLGTNRGGTGITSNPSMLVNLGSTSAASVFASDQRPGITGTLPIGHGGTGYGDSGEKTITNSSVFEGTIRYRRVGNLLFVYNTTNISLKSALSSGSVTLCTLPTEYQPERHARGIYAAFANANVGIVMVSAAGNITLYSSGNSLATSSNIYINIIAEL